MSSFQDDRFGDGDQTSVREPAIGQPQHPQQGAPSPMPHYVQQQPFAQQQQQYPPQPFGYGQPHGYGQGYGGGSPWGMRPRRQFPIETKPFFLTSEFVAATLAVAGIAITAMASDAFGAWRAWILITAVVIGYMISRGVAKSGTRSHSSDPREHLDLNWGRSEHGNDA
jgi:hypothetical protein